MAKVKSGLRVFLKPNGQRCPVSAKVVASGGKCYLAGNLSLVTPSDIKKILVERLRDAQDVYIGDEAGGVRVYLILDKKTKKLRVSARAYGDIDKMVSDLEWCVDEASSITLNEARKRDAAHAEWMRNNRENITPDTVVTCPKCGTEFRVGKKLA